MLSMVLPRAGNPPGQCTFLPDGLPLMSQISEGQAEDLVSLIPNEVRAVWSEHAKTKIKKGLKKKKPKAQAKKQALTAKAQKKDDERKKDEEALLLLENSVGGRPR